MKKTKHDELKKLTDYVTRNSSLCEDEFTFTLPDENGFSHFVIAKDNKIMHLGAFTYGTFIRAEYAKRQEDVKAIEKFLNLCIQKAEKPETIVPPLVKKPEDWDKIYK